MQAIGLLTCAKYPEHFCAPKMNSENLAAGAFNMDLPRLFADVPSLKLTLSSLKIRPKLCYPKRIQEGSSPFATMFQGKLAGSNFC